MQNRSFRHWVLLGTSGFVCSCFIPVAQAEVRLVENQGFVVDASLTIGAGYFATANTNFGAGVTRPNGSVDDSADWGEGYVLPRLTGSFTGDIGQAYGGVAVVGSATLGETGDAGGFTPDDPSDVALEEFYVGWRSGATIPGGEDVLDLSAGRQPFQIGDGFLIWDGNFDSGSKGAFWLAPRLSFKQTAIARVNVLPVRADLFYLDSDTDQGNTELAGVNVEIVEGERGTIGASYMHIIDSDFATRNGMDVYSIRGQGNPSLDVPDLFLAGEYAHQDNSNDGDSFAVDADAWYLEAGYQLSQVPWAPRLSYRFSCQSAPNFDPRSASKIDPSLRPVRVRPEAMRGAIGGAQRIAGGRSLEGPVRRGS